MRLQDNTGRVLAPPDYLFELAAFSCINDLGFNATPTRVVRGADAENT